MFFTEKITTHYVASPPTTSTCSKHNIRYVHTVQYMCKLLWKSLFHPWEDTIGRAVCTPLSTHFVRHAQNAQKRRKLISFGSKVTRLFICLAFLPVGSVAPAFQLGFVYTQRTRTRKGMLKRQPLVHYLPMDLMPILAKAMRIFNLRCIPRKAHYKDIHRRTIEIVQRNRTLEDNCCLKVHNAHIKLASPISG